MASRRKSTRSPGRRCDSAGREACLARDETVSHCRRHSLVPAAMPIVRLSDLADKAACPRLVVKVGSSLLVGREGLRRAWVEALVAEIAEARGRGQDVI